MRKIIFCNITFLLWMLFSAVNILSQGFNGIIPLESNCEDVKRVLNVEKCDFPKSYYHLKDFRVAITFNQEASKNGQKWCYKTPVGKVISVNVSYNSPISMEKFPYQLKFAEKSENDIETHIYSNSDKGISAFIHNGLITNAIFLPTPKQHKNFAYECGKPCD